MRGVDRGILKEIRRLGAEARLRAEIATTTAEVVERLTPECGEEGARGLAQNVPSLIAPAVLWHAKRAEFDRRWAEMEKLRDQMLAVVSPDPKRPVFASLAISACRGRVERLLSDETER